MARIEDAYFLLSIKLDDIPAPYPISSAIFLLTDNFGEQNMYNKLPPSFSSEKQLLVPINRVVDSNTEYKFLPNNRGDNQNGLLSNFYL